MANFVQNRPQWVQRFFQWAQGEFLDRGSRIAGGQFSRKKWRELQDELRAKAEAERARDAAAAKALSDARKAEQRAGAIAREQYRQDLAAQAAGQLAALRQSNADQVAQQVAVLRRLAQDAAQTQMLAQHHAQAMDRDDEDEALALLLT